jgi:transposase InsO family protein
MKDSYHQVSLVKLCRLLGITRQAYYQHLRRFEERSIETHLVVQQVQAIRKNHRRMGGRKLYEKLESFMLEHQIKMGRDALFDLLAANNLLVKKRRTRVYTTNSFHWLRKYPNLIKNMPLTRKNQLWVSDITYWKVREKFYYISFVTDAYSKKIVGYHVAETLEAVASIQALKMAIQGLSKEPDCHFELTHHSDRGIQYCSKEYVKLLQDNGIQISMTENGDPRENAIAERINGIIKNEYLIDYQVNNINEANEFLGAVVNLYNEERPHLSIGLLTPNQVHNDNLKTEQLWKNYYPKKDNIVNPLQDINKNVNIS